MDPYLGQILLLPYGNRRLDGWALCDGSLLTINGNQGLYSLLGVQFGGDGKTTFGLPDLRGRVPACIRPGSTEFGVTGLKGGEEAVTLTTNNMPPHNHTAVASSTAATSAASANAYYAQVDGKPLYATPTVPADLVSINQGSVRASGGGKGHSNMQPFLVLAYYIATIGIYPPRPY